jgi:peroxiredoxin
MNRNHASISAAMRRAWRLRSLAAAAVLLAIAVAAGCGGGAKTESGSETVTAGNGEVGTTAPAFALPDLEGKTVSSAEFAGKVVVLDFWATWCPPCREEVPHFVRLQSKYRAQGLQIVGLSVDAGGAKDVAPFADEYNVNYTMLLANDELVKAFGNITFLPTTFVLDRQGKIVKKFTGIASPEAFEAVIAPLLATTS